jgi:hypothetical protein
LFTFIDVKEPLDGIPEIWILNVRQIIKGMGIGIENRSIRLSLSSNLPLVPPDQKYPGTEDYTDEARVEP